MSAHLGKQAMARAATIYAYCMLHSGEKLTITGVAKALGRRCGRQFSEELSAARHIALDKGEEITNCVWDEERRNYIFYHLMPGQDHGRALPGFLALNRHTRTHIRNEGRHASWLAEHGEGERDRAWGRVGVKFSEVTQSFLDMMDEFDVITRDQRERERTSS